MQIPMNKNIGTHVTQTKSYSTTLHPSEILFCDLPSAEITFVRMSEAH